MVFFLTGKKATYVCISEFHRQTKLYDYLIF
jgi:hypothetical protein